MENLAIWSDIMAKYFVFYNFTDHNKMKHDGVGGLLALDKEHARKVFFATKVVDPTGIVITKVLTESEYEWHLSQKPKYQV